MSASSEALAPGTVVRDLEVARTLGVGGFGITYLARDRQLDQMMAMKEYLPRWSGMRLSDGRVGPRNASMVADYDRGLQKFRQEARALAKLNHPLIVRVYRVFPMWGTAYMVMEYIEGQSLREELKSAGTLEEPRVRGLLSRLTEGLAQVHEADLLHRDVKPENVMLRADGSPALVDFGAARYKASERSQASLVQVLTHGYAAIEQYGSAGLQGQWTDIYALAAIAYEALSGVAPARATNRVRNDPVAPLRRVAPRVSKALALAVDRGLAVYAEDRPPERGRMEANACRARIAAAPTPAVTASSAPGSGRPSLARVRSAPRSRAGCPRCSRGSQPHLGCETAAGKAPNQAFNSCRPECNRARRRLTFAFRSPGTPGPTADSSWEAIRI